MFFLKASLSLVLLLAFSACTKSGSSTKGEPGKVSGTITVAPEIATKLKPTDVLYIIARREQVGPPTAVKRVVQPKFPLTYTLGPEDAMMPGMGGFDPDTNITIAARISRTGNATPSAGDLEGVFEKNPAHPGDGGIDVKIDRER